MSKGLVEVLTTFVVTIVVVRLSMMKEKDCHQDSIDDIISSHHEG